MPFMALIEAVQKKARKPSTPNINKEPKMSAVTLVQPSALQIVLFFVVVRESIDS